MARKGMTSQKQWERYRATHPDGYSLTQFRVALRRYERLSNPLMRMEQAIRRLYLRAGSRP